MSAVLVRITKPFDALRTPCPATGTQGRWYADDGEFCIVEFDLPFICTQGYEWLPFDEETTMRLKFYPDEIEMVE